VQRSVRDVLAGLTFAVFGVAFAIGAATYVVGTPLRMGPGFYPLVVGVLLVALGVIIAIRPVIASSEDEPLTAPAWRPLVLILGAIVLFALTVRGLGLIPSVFGASLMAILASRRTALRTSLLVAAGLTIVSVLIFGIALNLRLPLLGPWIPRV
jgi:hypothetical protein